VSIAVLELGVIVTAGVIIVSVVYELAAMLLRRQDDDTYDGRTKR
jgi:hypothetical protein